MKLLLAFLLAAAAAFPQASRTWVSGVGDDTNPCSRTAPCLTLAGALANTAPGGTISILDPSEPSTVIIDKSITIEGDDSLTSIDVAAGTAIIINAGNSATVILRNLQFQGGDIAGASAIDVQSAATVEIIDCTFDRFPQTVINNTAAASETIQILIRNSTFSGGGTGVNQNQFFSTTHIIQSSFTRMANPIAISAGTMQVTRSSFNGSSTATCAAATGIARFRALNNTFTSCNIGLLAAGTSSVYVCKNRFAFNQTDITQQSTPYLYTCGDNTFLTQPTAVTLRLNPFADFGLQTIDFPAIPSQLISNSPLSANATASSGLTVTLASTTPTVCTVAAGTITLIHTGTCTITASQPGNASFLPAPQVTRSFTVLPGAASFLSFAIQPAAGTWKVPSASPIRVQVLDGYGNVITTFAQPITLSIATGTLGTVMSCNGQNAPVTAAPTSGIASFDQCQFSQPGIFTLTASAPGLPPITSTAFRIFETFTPPEFSFNSSTIQLTATTGNLGALASVLLYNSAASSSMQFTGTPAWLRLEQRNAGNPTLFWLTPDATNLAPGVYTAQLAAELSALSLRSTIDLRLTVLPCSASIYPDNITLKPEQNSAGVLVGAERNCPWTATTQAPWVHITQAVTSGTGAVTFTFDSNPTGQPRAALVNVLGSQLMLLQPAN